MRVSCVLLTGLLTTLVAGQSRVVWGQPLAGIVGPAECRVCRGGGLVPRDPLPVYVQFGDPNPAWADRALAHRACPGCQTDDAVAPLLQQERERLQTAGERHRFWEQRLQTQLVRVETHLLVIHAEGDESEARKAASAVEAMTRYLQQTTDSLMLTPRHPRSDELLILANRSRYEHLLSVLEASEKYRWVNWELMRKRVGSSVERLTFLYSPPGGPPVDHIAVYSSAYRQIQLATEDRAPAWLCEGFAAHCEFAVLKQNRMHGIVSQSRSVRLPPNWSVQLRRLARRGELLSWAELLRTDHAEYEMRHYLQCKSVVEFLLRSPQPFLDLVTALARGLTSEAALQESFGSLDEIETRWLASLKAGR